MGRSRSPQGGASGSITVLRDADRQVLRLAGRIDAAVVDAFERDPAADRARASAATRMEIDMSAVTSVDAVGLDFVRRQLGRWMDDQSRRAVHHRAVVPRD